MGRRQPWREGRLGDLPCPFRATVDWPAAAFWRELSLASPDAVVVLSVPRERGVVEECLGDNLCRPGRGAPPDDEGAREELAMIGAVIEKRFTPDWRDREGAIAAYEAHNARVRAEVPEGRLVEWRPGDGWAPLCAALGMEEPSEPFPHLNTSSEFRAMTGLDVGGS